MQSATPSENQSAAEYDAYYDFLLVAAISKELKAQGMTQQELGQRSGLSTSFITHVMGGGSNLSLKSLVSIAQAFNVPVTRLLEPSDTPNWGYKNMAYADQFPANRVQEALPKGYVHVECVLPADRAAIVKQWAEITQGLLKRDASPPKKKK